MLKPEMQHLVTLGLTSACVLLLALSWIYPRWKKRRTAIPGLEPSTKEDGNFPDVCRLGGFHYFLHELHQRFGDMAGFWWGPTYVVSIASPELFKQTATVFDRPPFVFEMFVPLIGSSSVQYANGAEGRARRRLYDQAFVHSRMFLYHERFQQVAEKVAEKWEEKGEIGLDEETASYTSSACLPTIMGDIFEDENLLLDFKNAYKKLLSKLEPVVIDPLTIHRPRVSPEDVEPVETIMKKVIDHRRKSSTQGNLIIDEILASAEDEVVVLSDCLTFAFASFQNIGNLLTWVLYLLAIHKECQDKVFQEIQDVLKNGEAVDNTNVSKLTYMRQVIDETLRCISLGPFTARVQDVDSELGGYTIPKNTPVLHALCVASQNEKYFPEPTKFDPDRFSANNKKSRPILAFTPFGFAGNRKCPGSSYTYFMSCVFLATIIRRFEISMCSDRVVKPVHAFFIRPEEEIWVKVTPRK